VEISRNGPQGSLFTRPFDLAIEPDGNLVVADMGEPNQKDGAVIRVDPVSGRQSLVSSGGLFYDPAGIAVGLGGDLYVVDNLAADNSGGVIRVDPRTGEQQLIASNAPGLPMLFDLPFGIAVDPDGSLVVSNRRTEGDLPAQCAASGSVIRVDPTGGATTLISPLPGPPSLFARPLGVAVDADRSIVVANECTGAAGLVRVAPVGGRQQVVTRNDHADVLSTPERIAFDPTGDLLVSDYSLGADGDGGIVKVDAETGGQTVLQSGELFNHPLGIAAVVNHPPSAALWIAPRRVAAGQTVRLDGSGSRDPERLRLAYEWDLDGDGSFEFGTGGNPAATRAFTVDGPTVVRMRVNDPHGGRAVAEAALTVDGSMPILTRVRAAERVLAVGRPERAGTRRRRPPRATSVSFQLSEPGTVTVSVQRARAGRRTGDGECRPKARRGRRCVAWSTARRIRRVLGAGDNAIELRASGLRPGRYRLVVTAVDWVGNRSQRRTVALRVVQR
jgi:DNA-binding beta-propeller fold protein YncE